MCVSQTKPINVHFNWLLRLYKSLLKMLSKFVVLGFFLPDLLNVWIKFINLSLISDRYLDLIESAVSNGECVLIESIGESLDPVLDPILGRNTIKKGRSV